MRFAVYLVTCTVNGKQYVGKAADPVKRWRNHRYLARKGSGYRLHNAMRKHGASTFRFEVLGWYDTEDGAYDAEAKTIAALGTMTPRGLNLNEGGRGSAHGKQLTTAGLVTYNRTRADAVLERNAEIAKAYRDGVGPRALARRYGIAPKSVIDALAAQGVARRPVPPKKVRPAKNFSYQGKLTAAHRVDVVARRLEGLSLASIAKWMQSHHGVTVSKQAVAQMLRALLPSTT